MKVVRPRRSRLAAAVCWAYLLALGGLICYLRIDGDSEWLSTVLLFSPRWIFAAPLALLLPMAVYGNCRLPIALGFLVGLFPLMGLCIGWHRFVPAPAGSQTLRVVTFNLHETPLSAPGFRQFMADSRADVLAFEEMPYLASRRDFPAELNHITRHGQQCVASRYPIHTVEVLRDGVVIRYRLDTPGGPVDLIGVHLSSPHWALRDSINGAEQGPYELARNIADRRDEAELLRRQIEQAANRPLVIAGDFNLTPDSPLFTSNFAAMSDAFESAGMGFGWTYFHQHAMVRIDHVLSNRFFRCRQCAVGPNLGSPHRPLVAELVFEKP